MLALTVSASSPPTEELLRYELLPQEGVIPGGPVSMELPMDRYELLPQEGAWPRDSVMEETRVVKFVLVDNNERIFSWIRADSSGDPAGPHVDLPGGKVDQEKRYSKRLTVNSRRRSVLTG